MDQDVVPFAAVPQTSASAALLVPMTKAHVETQSPAAARAARRRHPLANRNMCSPFLTVDDKYRPGVIPKQRLRAIRWSDRPRPPPLKSCAAQSRKCLSKSVSLSLGWFLAAAPIAGRIRGYVHDCIAWLTLVRVLVEVRDSGGGCSRSAPL